MTIIAITLIIVTATINAICVGLACTSDECTKDTPVRNLFWAVVMERTSYDAPTLAIFGVPTRTQRALAWIGRQSIRLENFINTCNEVDVAADRAIVSTVTTWTEEQKLSCCMAVGMFKHFDLRTELNRDEHNQAACAASFNAASIRRGWMELTGLARLQTKVNAFIAA